MIGFPLPGELIRSMRESRGGRGLISMGRVVYALMLRESRTRYGKSDLGYSWALIEPLLQLLILWGIYTAFGRVVPLAASMPVFLVTGILPYHFWRDCVQRGASGVASNLPLLTYPQVRPSDVIVSRILLEAATTALVTLLFVVGLKMFYREPLASWVDEPLAEVGAIAALFYFGMSFGFLSSGLARVFPPWSELFSYLSRPLWFISGIFFTLESLPIGARGIASLNPIAHLLEWIRSAALPGFESEHYSRTFVLVTATVALSFGLLIDRYLTLTGHSDENH
jgi:capsular polysaccharide transport system permease protein